MSVATVRRLAVLFLAAPFLAGGCRGAPDTGDAGLVLDLAISPTPPAVGSARLIITLSDSTGAPVDGAEIQVEGNMSHAGMVPVRGTAEAEGDGRYSVPEFRFSMAGDWILTTRATLPDGRWVESITGTTVVSPIRDMGAEIAPGAGGVRPARLEAGH